jgi:hypothetical protein
MLAIVITTLLACGDLCSRDAMAHYSELLREGGYGRLSQERAGFLIAEEGGTVSFQPWDSFAFRRASYRGRVPDRTIAIAHTHPSNSPEPSTRDRATARQSGLPVVVITPEGVVGVFPDGSTRALAGRDWWLAR